jgi:hypothetical protein
MTVEKYPGHETFVFSAPLYPTFLIENAQEDELLAIMDIRAGSISFWERDTLENDHPGNNPAQ